MNRKEAIEIIKNSNIHGARMNGKNLIIEAINELVKDITLADLLGWEEGQEYEYRTGAILMLDNEKIYYKSDGCSSRWCNYNFFGNEIEDLRQAKKVEKKLKAYHVKDEYSYNELMKELEEQGYEWRFGAKPTKSDIWRGYKNGVIIYCKEDKTITHSWLTYYENCKKDKYDLIEYYKEEPKFYAKIKGWELISSTYCHFGLDDLSELEVVDRIDGYRLSKSEWEELGINGTNADFEEVEE